MKLAVIDLESIAAYMFKLYKTLEKAKSPQVIRDRIINCQELLDLSGITVEAHYDGGGNLFEVQVYQVAKKTTGSYD